MNPRTHRTPAQVRSARARAKQTQTEAAELVGLGSKTRWSEYETGVQAMDAARWTLYLLLTRQHPELEVTLK